ncbi:hypothetical protein [Rhizosphaericola mali]|uniref:Tetratricopeptide repeat protein n=1 Tax=Rhizosphaericola mali TaxID=2545455 RepID=A0A5P2G261_9BACT|nr:hypothetical protein [Rhizosphaericola mali]QES87930.1 hypothetical protein E0W69_004375 [Rhizosphaericola mali]
MRFLILLSFISFIFLSSCDNRHVKENSRPKFDKLILKCIPTTAIHSENPDKYLANKDFKNNTEEGIYDVLKGNYYLNKFGAINDSSEYYFNDAFVKISALDIRFYLWLRVNYAWYLYRIRKTTQALDFYNKVIQTLDENPKLSLIDPVNTYKWIGYFLGTIDEKQTSIVYLKKALAYGKKNTLNSAEIKDNIGTYFLDLKQFDSAQLYYDQAEKDALNLHDSSRLAKLFGNQSRIAVFREDMDEAITLLQKDLEIVKSEKDSNNMVLVNNLIGKTYEENKEPKKAYRYFDTGVIIARKFPVLNSDEYELLKKQLNLIRTHHFLVDTTSILLRINALRDIIDSTDGQNAMILTRQKYLNDQVLNKNKNINAHLSQEINLKWIFVILFLIISILSLLIYWKYKNKLVQKNIEILQFWDQINRERAQSEARLAKANNELKAYIVYLNERNELIQDLEYKLTHSNLVLHPDKSNQQIIYDYIQDTLITEENWQNFKKAFVVENVSFVNKLHQDYPKLTESNLRILFLSKLNLSNNEIANVLGVSYDAVKKSKQRLKAKYGIDFDKLDNL